jgi:hypothetical protein
VTGARTTSWPITLLAAALPEATLKPVGPGVRCMSHELSELTDHLPPLSFIRPYSSSMPLGGVITLRLLDP